MIAFFFKSLPILAYFSFIFRAITLPVEQVFKTFWNQERAEAIQQLCRSENFNESAVNQMIANYKFSGKEPLRETVLSACNVKPKLLERKKIFKRVVARLLEIIDKFDDALGDFERTFRR